MVVEVLLHMDEVDAVLSQELADACGVGSLVSRDIVSVQKRWQSGNIERDNIEVPGGLSTDEVQEGKQRNDVTECGPHLGFRISDGDVPDIFV